MKHTPGPWSYHPSDKSREYFISDNPNATKDGVGWGTNIIADVHCVSHANDHEANARLIAAAPDMLAALQEIIRNCELFAKPDNMAGRICQIANQAISNLN